MKKYDYIIAIDPDCDKSGACFLETETKELALKSLCFPDLIQILRSERITSSKTGSSLIVLVEAGWLNESNWHLNKFDSKALAASKGNAVGRNHETGRKIVEMCKYYGLEVQEIKPLKKFWNGKDGKITHDEISNFIPGFPNKSNQEVRDAALIAWHYAGFPIRVKPIKK